MTTANLPRIALASLIALGFALFAPNLPAEAGHLQAKPFLLTDRIPRGASEQQLLRFARKHHAKALQESKEPNQNDRKWRANLVVSFNRPVGDLEFQVLFYDVEDRERRLIEDMSTMVSDRTQKTFVQKLKLPRSRFKANRDMELVVTVRHQEVGRAKFRLVGERKQHSGTVDFADDER